MWIAVPPNWAITGETAATSPHSGTVFGPFQYTFWQLSNPDVAEAFGAHAPEVDRPQGTDLRDSTRPHGVRWPLEFGANPALLDFPLNLEGVLLV